MSKSEDSDYFSVTIRHEDEIAKITQSQFKEDFEFYERLLDLAFVVTKNLSNSTKTKRPSHDKAAILLMLPRIFGTMQSIRILGMKGYYYEVAILERTLLENFGLYVYLARNEDEARNWLKGKQMSIPNIRLSIEMVSSLSQEMRKRAKVVYGELCDFVHTNLRAVGPSFLTPSSDEESRIDVDFPPFYKRENVSYVSAFPAMLLLIIMEVFKKELRKELTDKIWNVFREWERYIETQLKWLEKSFQSAEHRKDDVSVNEKKEETAESEKSP